jgi:putative oxidoreductase
MLGPRRSAGHVEGEGMNANTQADLGKLVLRIALGVLVLLHGVSKLRGGVGPIGEMLAAHGLPAFLAYGALVGEVVGPLMLIAGFYARIGALLVMVNMLFAFFLAHLGQLGMLNEAGGWQLELQGMYLATAAALALLGPGRYSVNGR